MAIDAIRLHDALWRLNEVFSDEKIVKILGEDDALLLKLQRDFGVYCVNLFSIHEAARVLSLPDTSLIGVLAHFTGRMLRPLSRLCDWRYARRVRGMQGAPADAAAAARRLRGGALPPLRLRLHEAAARRELAARAEPGRPLSSFATGRSTTCWRAATSPASSPSRSRSTPSSSASG